MLHEDLGTRLGKYCSLYHLPVEVDHTRKVPSCSPSKWLTPTIAHFLHQSVLSNENLRGYVQPLIILHCFICTLIQCDTCALIHYTSMGRTTKNHMEILYWAFINVSHKSPSIGQSVRKQYEWKSIKSFPTIFDVFHLIATLVISCFWVPHNASKQQVSCWWTMLSGSRSSVALK